MRDRLPHVGVKAGVVMRFAGSLQAREDLAGG
jgi:hypothetical protein